MSDFRENARIANGIRAAVRDGVPDEQILKHLTTESSVSEGIKAAMTDGVPATEIINHLGRLPSNRSEYTKQFDPTSEMSGFDKFRAGWGKGVSDLGRGAGQLVGAVDRQDVDEARKLEQNLMNTKEGRTGEIVGKLVTTAPAAAIPGANTALGAAAIGGATGALEPVGTNDSRLFNIGMGGAGGYIGNKVVGAAARVISPNTRPEVQQLLDEGITPTPGKILGGAAERAEEGLTSVPIVGDAIKSAQRRSVESFDRAALNRVLEPLQKKLDSGESVGHEAVAKVGNLISKAYDDLLPKLKVSADDAFSGELDTLRGLAKSMPAERSGQFENILKTEVLDKFTQHGLMSGETMKAVESKLGLLVRKYGASNDGDQRLLSDAIKETQSTLRRLVERSNPQEAGSLKSLNTAWANLVRVENAAGRLGSKEGVFSPAALRGAVKASDSSVRKRAFSRGEALMQDLAESGEKVLGSKVPDSGTAYRLAPWIIGAGAGYAGNEGWISPENAAVAMMLSGAYTRPGQYLSAALLSKRPAGSKALANVVRKRLSPYAAALAGGAAANAAKSQERD